MIFSSIQQAQYNAAYSNIPMIFGSDNIDLLKFKYLINICYNPTEITGMTPYYNGPNLSTMVECVEHKFKIGDSVFIVTGQYTGFYIVKTIIGTDRFSIDLVMGIPFDYVGDTYVSNYIPYKILPNELGNANVDISNTIKDFVKSTIIDTNEIINGDSTMFTYFMVAGEEYQYQYIFADNGFFSGNVGFYNPSITDIDEIKLEIGDSINIMQDIYSWGFSDITDDGNGRLTLSASYAHVLQVNDDITIFDIVDYPTYNGPTKVLEVIDNFKIIVDVSFLGNQSGLYRLTANIPPEYNTNATIIDIYINPNPAIGAVVLTDLPFARSTPPIAGRIQSLTTGLTRDFNYLDENVSYVYDFRLDRLDLLNYSVGNIEYDNTIITKYFTLVNGLQLNISTILKNMDKKFEFTNIEYTTKSFLLNHISDVEIQLGYKYTFYESYEDVIDEIVYGESVLENTDYTRNLYFPVGIIQLINNGNLINIGSFDLESKFKNVKYYTINGYNVESNEVITNLKLYKINEQCSYLPNYQLIWKDAYGSWINYSFPYQSNESENIDRSTFYSREGSFTETDFKLPVIDRGQTTFFVKSRKSIDLTTGIINDYENYLISDLLKSTEVFIQQPSSYILDYGEDGFLIDEYGDFITNEFGDKIIIGSSKYFEFISNIGELIPVTIENNSHTYGTRLQNSIFEYKLKVTYAFNDYRF